MVHNLVKTLRVFITACLYKGFVAIGQFACLWPIVALLWFSPSISQNQIAKPFFSDITDEVGLKSAPFTWPDGTYDLPEVIGGGIAVFDYDNDGDLDILQICFSRPGQTQVKTKNRLFEQKNDGTFIDVTDQSHIGDEGYGQGIAIGDVDNDGHLDVYFTNLDEDAFYHNNGDGTFTETTSKTFGTSNQPSWSSAAAFVDYDQDNDLDLYVVGYVVHDDTQICYGDHGLPDYCNPRVFNPAPDRLYQNQGDGTFIEISTDTGIGKPARGLGVVCADFTDDGLIDFYVANDGEANQLWVNLNNGQFQDQAILYGLAFNAYGQAEGSMGVAIGDVNQDQSLDLLLTHLTGETNTLYLATEYSIFMDNTDISGFSGSDAPFTGFGCALLDFDNDGDLDLAIANGRVKKGPVLSQADLSPFWNAYAEPNLLFSNNGSGIFTEVDSRMEPFCQNIEINRGLACGDIDNDGDIDLVLDRLGQLPRVFKNQSSETNSWLTVRAITHNRPALGAKITLITDKKSFLGQVIASSGYLSSNDCRLHFGLGDVKSVRSLEIDWPDGQREQFTIDDLNQQITILQGTGNPR